jgi:hypothetical protein
MEKQLSASDILIATWGVGGVLLLLGQAIWRLGSRALEAFDYDLTIVQIVTTAVWIVFSVYAEGYRAFQLRFSPRVVARALYVARAGSPLQAAFAPAFCMSFFHATRRGKIVAWSTVVLVVCLVLIVSSLPQPWRGIIDAGVVLALLWGALAIVVFYTRALGTGIPPKVDPALPQAATGADATPT